MDSQQVHHYHHHDNDGPRVSVKLERNSRGFNYEISVTGCRDSDEWVALMTDAKERIEQIIAQEGGVST